MTWIKIAPGPMDRVRPHCLWGNVSEKQDVLQCSVIQTVFPNVYKPLFDMIGRSLNIFLTAVTILWDLEHVVRREG